MSEVGLLPNIDEGLIPALQEFVGDLDRGQGEAVLDFSSVRRIDSEALRALEDCARVAGEKNVKVVLRGINVDVYKVLKLARLTQKFSFAS